MRARNLAVAAVAGLATVLQARADAPSFDRPGIAFSTSTLAPGTFDIEQGLPDAARDDAGGVRATLYSADTRLRAGLTGNLEVQVATSLYNRLHVSGGAGGTDTGTGDTGVALKLAVPGLPKPWSAAVLGGVTFDSGDEAFTAGHSVVSLAGTLAYALDDARSVSFYTDLDRSDGDTTCRLSPSFSWAVADDWSVFAEAGATFSPHAADDVVAGGGVTWMITSTVQLDAYVDVGLTDASTDVLAGLGVSAYFDLR
jgi:hypothetical protein